MDNKISAESPFYYSKEFNLSSDKKLYIRNAITKDASDIINFFKAASDESENLSFSSSEYHVTDYQEKIAISTINQDYQSIMMLGFIDEELCCVAELITPVEIRFSHNVEYSITVKKKFWNMGIGSIVTKEAIKYAESVNVKNITLSVRSENCAAIGIYEKYGFEKTGIRKNYFCVDGKFDDEIFMQLQLY